jgi:hypothetical protein
MLSYADGETSSINSDAKANYLLNYSELNGCINENSPVF